jgi:hypothetical protein
MRSEPGKWTVWPEVSGPSVPLFISGGVACLGRLVEKAAAYAAYKMAVLQFQGLKAVRFGLFQPYFLIKKTAIPA